jgi:NAD(P)-dependent dehydrogenase (short-subunit alcohol dehydrogenase family)
MLLRDRVALITGGGRGLGAEIARHYVAAGADVMLCGRDEARLQETVERLRNSTVPEQKVEARQADASVKDQVDAVVAETERVFGRIDVLVNNAGVYGPMGLTHEVDWDAWVHGLTVNLLGVVVFCRAAAPGMIARGRGKIVNISGGAATGPLPRLTCYAASKAAVVRFTESLALELQPYGIEVNAMAPGALVTQMMDQVIAAGAEAAGAAFHARMLKIQAEGGTPLEVGASLAVYLGSSDSDGITGRLMSAPWDPWRGLRAHREALASSDIYTLRRIVPSDRGLNWDEQP